MCLCVCQGKRHGNGHLIKDDGSEYQGDFRFDSLHGAGRWRSREGDVYEGKFAEAYLLKSTLTHVSSSSYDTHVYGGKL